MAKKKISLTVSEEIIDQAKIKAIKSKTTVSKAVDAFLWAWVAGKIDVSQLLESEKQRSTPYETE